MEIWPASQHSTSTVRPLEKIYTRSVNKSGLALRVIDGKNFKSLFTEQELSNLVLNDTWVQCDKCEKWRMLRGEEDLPGMYEFVCVWLVLAPSGHFTP